VITIEDLEARIQSLVEVQLIKYIPGYKPEDQVAHLMAAAMHDNLVNHDEIFEAPNIYTIIARPTMLVYWSKNPNLLVDIANALQETGSEAGFYFCSRPKVTVSADINMKPGEIRVLASFSTEPVSETRDISTVSQPEETRSDAVPMDAFLVHEGTKIIPLDKSVINIGRRLTNNIVIDDPRISRSHAQLRVINGHYVVFDLESSGGTFVNGQRISKSVLNPGDVISLAGVRLIYGQDPKSGQAPEEHTTPASSLSFSNPTLVPRSKLDNNNK
jgi:hypothetical protein